MIGAIGPRPLPAQAVEFGLPSESPAAVLRRRLADSSLCIRCGTCLPACPTFAASGLERESPRGRVQLVQAVADGRLAPDDYFLRQMFDCLDCRACEELCPVGVPIGARVLEGREVAQLGSNSARRRPVAGSMGKWILEHGFFAHPRRMEWPVFLGRWLYQRPGLQAIVRAIGLLRPFRLLWLLDRWLPVLPARPWRWRYDGGGERVDPPGAPRMRVAYFLGCFMNTVFADAAAASTEVLRRNSVEVIAPRGLRCCGAPQMDLGDVGLARDFAKANIAALEATGAAVVFSDCAACSGMLKEYRDLLEDDPDWGPRAAALGERVRDFSELMLELVPEGPPLGPVRSSVTYHDPCHLAHLQGVRSAPRELLRMIPGINFAEMTKADTCCGSAGMYSFRRPDASMAMLCDKIANTVATGAEVVVTGNPGCLGQLAMGLRLEGSRLPVRHLSQVLLESYEAGAKGVEA
jgi:glycolate oxidase iron-sulfur subunit